MALRQGNKVRTVQKSGILTYIVVVEKSSVKLSVRPNWAKAVKAENGQEMHLGTWSALPEGATRLSCVNKTKPTRNLQPTWVLAQDLSTKYPVKAESSASICENGRCKYGMQKAQIVLFIGTNDRSSQC